MSQTQVEKDREAVLETKKAANAADSSNPALTPVEQAELTGLQAEVK
jgi:hypothetical protein